MAPLLQEIEPVVHTSRNRYDSLTLNLETVRNNVTNVDKNSHLSFSALDKYSTNMD